MGEAQVHAIRMLLRIQEEIDYFNEVMIDEVLKIEDECNGRCKPLYDKRNEVIKCIPYLWRIAFKNHPVIRSFVQSEDVEIVEHLTSLEVEEFKDVKPGYSITLNFEANPYFENNKLTKTFTFLDERTTEITATTIKWKEGMVPSVAYVNKQKIRRLCDQSFFTWFSLMGKKVICEDFEDKIADSIKEDLWRNPLSYFPAVGTCVPYSFSPQCNPKGDKADDGGETERDELESNQINAPLIHRFEVLLEIQDDIDKINKEAMDKVLEVELRHNERCKDYYYVRHEIIRAIPDFWRIVFLSHPVLAMYIKEEDEKIFKHLNSLVVEGNKDHGESGYSITFKFEPNPYFEDMILTKTFTFLDERNTEISATSIKWKEGMVPYCGHLKKGHQMRPMDDGSFFMWFSLVESKDMIDGLVDEIADSIKEDLWPNPLSYFYSEPDGDEDIAKRPRLGEVRRGSSSSGGQSRKRAIRLSKYISEPQKFRSLEHTRHGSSPISLDNCALGVSKFLQNHIKCGQFERSEGEGTLFHIDTRLVTRRMFGCPMIRSFSKMLSEYYRANYGLFLEVVEVLQSVEGQSVSLDRAQCAKWFHLNFRANVQNGDCVSQKLYFAELLVFRFWFSSLHCHVAACLPIDLDVSGPCKCLFSKHDPEIYHPSVQGYVDDGSLMHPTFTPLLYSAQGRLEELACRKIRRKVRSFAWITPPSNTIHPFILESVDIYKCKNGSQALMEGGRGGSSGAIPICRYQSKKPTRMSRDIPVPKTILSLKEKRPGISNSQRQKIAFSMASRIENYNKPWPIVPVINPLIRTFLTVVPECYKQKYGVDFEAVNGLRICEVAKFEPNNFRRNARWFHMNFNAKLKDDGGDFEKLYFAEVVEIICVYNPNPITYSMTICVAIDQNDLAGNSPKCGICKPEIEICHPDSGTYLDDASKMDPSKLPEWKQVIEYLKALFPRRC